MGWCFDEDSSLMDECASCVSNGPLPVGSVGSVGSVVMLEFIGLRWASLPVHGPGPGPPRCGSAWVLN